LSARENVKKWRFFGGTEMKTQTLIFICLLLYIPCYAAENQLQSKESADIEKYISRLHNEIEASFKIRLIELNQRAQSEIRLLEVPDKAVTGASLAGQAEVAKAVLSLDQCGYRTSDNIMGEVEKVKDPGGVVEAYNKFSDKITLSPGRFAAAQSQIAERKSRILARLEGETLNLEQQKQYALTVELPQLEKQMKDNLSEAQPAAIHGVITGILYSADKPSAVIDGKIVHQGDSISGVTVVEISKDKVAFAKNGKKWQQTVQQKPQAYWK
jgi:hypothetical protein